MSDRYWSIKRHGDNGQYRNFGALPFAPASPADAHDGQSYLAGQLAGGRSCAAICGQFIAVTSRIVAVEGRWAHERCATAVAPRGRVAFAEQPSDDSATAVHGIAHVSEERPGEIMLAMPFDREVIDAIKACKRGRLWAAWAGDRRVWRVPATIWPCVERALREHGYEIRRDLGHVQGGGR